MVAASVDQRGRDKFAMASRLPALCKKSLFIDNEFRDATGRGTIEVVDAATEEVIATLTPASAVDLDQAVDSARRAFDGGGWSGIGGTARAAVLHHPKWTSISPLRKP